jgi:hypothetical protein
VYLVDETTDTIPDSSVGGFGYDGVMSSFVKTYDGNIGLLWIAGSYKIKFAVIKSFTPAVTKTSSTLYDGVKKAVKSSGGYPSFDVTRLALNLGDPDSDTGWYKKNYTSSSIEMAIVTSGSQRLVSSLGYYVGLDGLGFTMDTVEPDDKITDGVGKKWQIATVKPQMVGDVLHFYACDLKELSVYG